MLLRSLSCDGPLASSACCRSPSFYARAGPSAMTGPPSPRWAFVSSACFSFSTISQLPTRLQRAQVLRSPLCRCRQCWLALLRAEPLTWRKSAGVGIAILGVFAALALGLSAAPPGAWRGELIMTAAVVCMAFYNVLSRPFMERSSALGFLTVSMGFGAAVLMLAGLATNRLSVLDGFDVPQWIAGVYLGIGGGALAFILWVLALQRATPTRVANTMTVNPIAAALLATLLVGEPITLNLVVGLVAVFLGIWIATTEPTKPS